MLNGYVDFVTMLIGAEGTKTPAGGSPDRPRKAKCLERKSKAKFNTAFHKERVEKSYFSTQSPIWR